MDNFIVKLISGDILKITAQEYQNLVKQTNQSGVKGVLVFIPSNNQSINTSSISHILSEEKYNLELREKRGKSDKGVLHDGTPVVRKFGRYYLLSDPECEVDPTYYKEVAKDCVPTPQEYYKNYAELPEEKRLEAILGTIDDDKRLGGGFKQLKDIGHNK